MIGHGGESQAPPGNPRIAHLGGPGLAQARAGLLDHRQLLGGDPDLGLREVHHPAGVVPMAVAEDDLAHGRHTRPLELGADRVDGLVVLEKGMGPAGHALGVLTVHLGPQAGVKQQLPVAVADQDGGEIVVDVAAPAAAGPDQGLLGRGLAGLDHREGHRRLVGDPRGGGGGAGCRGPGKRHRGQQGRETETGHGKVLQGVRIRGSLALSRCRGAALSWARVSSKPPSSSIRKVSAAVPGSATPWAPR